MILRNPDVMINDPSEFNQKYDLKIISGRDRNKSYTATTRDDENIERRELSLILIDCGTHSDVINWMQSKVGDYALIELDGALWQAYIIGSVVEETELGRYEYTYDLELELLTAHVLVTEGKDYYITTEDGYLILV